MDKYEYKVRAEEIKNLIAQRDYAQAAEIADTIDWRRVKSVMMLCTISDLYKMNRRFEDARDMLLLAYERRPGGRNICYSLCELSIKTGEFVQAMEYYKEFVQVAPRDPGRYILQYKLYEDQDVSLEERIEVLEELKKHDYREKWAYELAYLYHRVGLATRCVEECDEMILWFGEGDYVIKAMELKMLHQPLSPEQQEKYDHRFDEPVVDEAQYGEAELSAESGMENFVGGDTQVYTPVRDEDLEQVNYSADFNTQDLAQDEMMQTEVFLEEPEESDELNIQVKTVDVGQYNTINLQAELAQGLRELLDNETPGIENPITRSIMEPMFSSDTESLDYPEIDEVSEDDLEPEAEEMEESEVFFGETGEIALEQVRLEEMTVGEVAEAFPELPAEEVVEEIAEEAVEEDANQNIVMEEAAEEVVEEVVEEEEPASVAEFDDGEQLVMEELEPMKMSGATTRNMTVIEPPKELAHVLAQESDGQISLVIPEKENVEKQITGQMNIEDILAEWERWKKENEAKHKEEVRQRVLQQTGNMFTEFEAAVRDGLLEQLEKSADEPEEVTVESDEVSDVVAESTEAIESDEVEEIEEVAEETVAEALIEETEAIEESDEVEEIAEVEESAEAEEDVREFVMIKEYNGADESEAQVEEAETAGEETEFVEEESEVEEVVEEEIVEEEIAEETEATSTKSGKARPMTKDEKELYGEYVQNRATAEQIVQAVDNITLAAYTGNVIITGESGMDILTLAKNMIREVQAEDSNFSGKVAKISGQGLNRKDVEETLTKLQNGALIIEDACDMEENTVQALYKVLQKENLGIIIVLLDDIKIMNRFLRENEYLLDMFTARVDVKALSNRALVEFGKKYAKEQEYAIDDLGVLALHTCIEQRQTIDHAVTTAEVQGMVDDAIRRANRKTPGHFFSILFSKRYDEEDMIIITEKDFV